MLYDGKIIERRYGKASNKLTVTPTKVIITFKSTMSVEQEEKAESFLLKVAHAMRAVNTSYRGIMNDTGAEPQIAMSAAKGKPVFRYVDSQINNERGYLANTQKEHAEV
jgi:alpha-acetolactate decarboxylase